MAPGDFCAAELVEAGESLVQSCSEDEQLAAALQPRRLRRFAGKRALQLVAVGAVLVVATMATTAYRQAPREDVDAAVQLFGAAALATAAGTLTAGSKVMTDMGNLPTTVTNHTKNALFPLAALKAQVNAKPGVSELKVDLTKMKKLTNQEMMRPISELVMHGNDCPDDEEMHQDLCYKKCSTLTQGKYPIRTTAFSCCMAEPCSFFNTKFTNALKPCDGFDVSGSGEGNGCPHPEGTCMANEEYNLGVCYKKCAILTENKFPWRSAAGTCCRYRSHAACLDPLNTMTKPEFNVRGWIKDGHASTPN